MDVKLTPPIFYVLQCSESSGSYRTAHDDGSPQKSAHKLYSGISIESSVQVSIWRLPVSDDYFLQIIFRFLGEISCTTTADKNVFESDNYVQRFGMQ
jgi:hypothetical protein